MRACEGTCKNSGGLKLQYSRRQIDFSENANKPTFIGQMGDYMRQSEKRQLVNR
jgi:hypothetical protein